MCTQNDSTKIYFYGIMDSQRHLSSRFALKTLVILLIYLFTTTKDNHLYSQDQCSRKVSLLTCTPGSELYSTFGHSAIRVKDSLVNTDIIFNYGTFDFNDLDFYEKFVKGRLLYFVSVDSLSNFLMEYEYFNRGVTEQVLNLDCASIDKLVAALYENAKEENRYYLYDFTHDNCTTRLRDMLENVSGKNLQTKNIIPAAGTSFRDMIHEYLDRGGQYWSKLGIDILLGSPLDRNVTNREAMFLPDYLFKAFDSSTVNGERLVSAKNQLLPAPVNNRSTGFFSPVVVMTIFLIIIAVASYFWKQRAFLKAFDVFFFGVLGMLGILLLFMWFGTNHPMCRNNLNLLWALPTHLPLAIMLFIPKKWVRSYFRVIFFFSLVLAVAWFFLPQEMNRALLPVLGIIIIRSYSISDQKNRYA
jgi:hypothetical protein